MKNFLTIAISLILLGSQYANAQNNICLGQDITVCQGQTVQISLCGGGTSNTSGIVLNAATTLPQLSDDSWSAAVNIGFSFSFYGTTYTQCVIGSNGLVSFNLANANGYCAYTLTGQGTLPGTGITGSRNSAMLFHSDINPSQTPIGPIKYQTIGTAPNRQFVVLFESVNAYSCVNTCYYGAFIFYETSNEIDFMIGQKPLCNSWNGGLAIQGVNSPSGATATITTGRNNSQWSANQDGRKVTPTSPSSTNAYSISTVPYIPVTSPGSSTQWANTNGQLFPYNNGVINVTSVPPGTTGYFLTATACGAAVGSVSDTSFITRIDVAGTATVTTDYCGAGLGTATANPTAGTAPFTYAWSPTGQTGQTATNLVTGPHSVTITDVTGCTKVLNINIPNANATFTAVMTQVSCSGGNDGTATATMNPILGNITYLWDDPAAQTTQTATGLSAGTYNCTITSDNGCTGVATVTVTEIPGMTVTITSQTDATCNSANNGTAAVNAMAGTSPYNYSWTGSSSTSNTANDLGAGVHTVTITDANTCVITLNITIGEPSALVITSTTPDSVICEGESIKLTATGSGGSSPYIFTWKENGSVVGVGDTIIVTPTYQNHSYTIILSETCGSPTTQAIVNVSNPNRIKPMVSLPTYRECNPYKFEFFNTSSYPSEIFSTFYDFGNNQTILLSGVDSTSMNYSIIGKYSVGMTIVNDRGCVYDTVFIDLLETLAPPHADFNISANPTTIFETTLKFQESSSSNVITYQWYAPQGTPTSSTLANPTFHYPEGIVEQYPVTLIVTTPEGCMDSITKIVVVNSAVLFYAPNAFTPDGDEFNQQWKFYVDGIDEFHFSLLIFNRWGEVIWETKDPNVAWDGTYKGIIVPIGAYSWTAEVKDLYNDSKYNFNGTITVLR